MTATRSLPRLAMTLGDVAGVGPEIVARVLLRHPELRQRCAPFVVGDAGALRNAVALIGDDPARVVTIGAPAEATNDPGLIEVVQVGEDLSGVPAGEVDARAGDGAYRYLTTACGFGRAGEIDGIVTAPLNKLAMSRGGHDWPGHTEILAHEFGVENFNLVLSAGDLYVFHLTTHVSLQDAITACTPERVGDVFNLAHNLAKALGSPDEAIAVAGLNPHAGEGRLFGDQDADVLEPAVAAARERGINAHGPVPADALFPAAVRGGWKIVIACYHDQGHAPFKTFFGKIGVNITMGLPIPRTSVDHGTAFDIAGQGIAQEESLLLACERAAELAPGWPRDWGAIQ